MDKKLKIIQFIT